MKKVTYKIILQGEKKTIETVKGYLFDSKTAVRKHRVFYPFLGWENRFIFDDLRTGYRVATVLKKKSYKEAMEGYKKDYKKVIAAFRKGEKYKEIASI